jgi:hypothetical protein
MMGLHTIKELIDAQDSQIRLLSGYIQSLHLIHPIPEDVGMQININTERIQKAYKEILEAIR